jgi:hypothetical protein
MSNPSIRDRGRLPGQRRWWITGALSLVTMGVLAFLGLGRQAIFAHRTGPAQPHPFSHRFHVGQKTLSCVFCHTGAIDTARAGVPPLSTCMLCHSRIIITHPQIEKLVRHYQESRPIEWVRVNELPDFVYFNHQIHVRAGFDCGKCHGDVAGMDRVAPVHRLDMGFCVSCHRQQQFSHDCLRCHR